MITNICSKCKINKTDRERRKTDESYRLRRLMSCAFYSFFNGRKPDSTFNILPYTLEELYKHLQSTIKPEYKGVKLHIDHIIPQSLYNPLDESDVRKCWDLRNLRYLPAKENLEKYDALDMELIEGYGIEDLLPEKVLTKKY